MHFVTRPPGAALQASAVDWHTVMPRVVLPRRLATVMARGAAVRAAAHASATVILSNFLRIAAGVAVLGLLLELGEAALRASKRYRHSQTQFSTKASGPDCSVSGMVRRHLAVDQLCPLKSHTPRGHPGMPCGLCLGMHSFGEEDEDAAAAEKEMIRLGQVKRTLPCGHAFHAICVDRVFLRSSRAFGCAAGLVALNCPTCGSKIA